ncbi:MAG: zinc-dependent metalloprotease [Armatimonadetes bacterium]|nr:zinc-dependent metalloprotease [Armatimonadota bacterium]
MNLMLTLALLAAGSSSSSPVHGFLQVAAPAPQEKAVKAEDKKQEEKKDPYQDAIKDYKKSEGVFTVFQKDDSYLFQIPTNLIGRDFLWTTELKKTPTGMFNGSPVGEGMVRFELRGDRLLLRSVGVNVVATDGEEIKRAVDFSNVDPIIKSFPVKAKAPDGAPLIDVSSYFKGDIAEFSAKGSLGGAMIDPERSYIESVKAFPLNVNVEVTQTAAGGGGGGRGFFGAAPPRTANTGVLLHSIVLLPEKPMMGRLWDSRVGYFSNGFTDYGTDEHKVKTYQYIARYRLEKKDPNAALSEPVKPIVYYVSREVPEKWRKYIKQGIEDWQPAFEAAGFKHAIIAKDAPTEKEDPNWDPEDVRYSVIRWAPLPIANAIGPHVSDPRSGEIMSAHVIVWHDILKLQTEWYFSQASPNDPRAQRLPMPDDLMGENLRFVVSHEVGHTLGLPHNGKSSAMIPVRLLRDPKWTKENGTCTSIMDYARFNYVAQPGDGASLCPKIGRYDKFAISWGYTPIQAAHKPQDEKRMLDVWASKQVGDPMLRFYDNFSSSDPTAQSEALGDNAVEASTYGVANLKRVMGFLVPASTKYGEDYSELAGMHGAVREQFLNYVFHVATVVGGIVQTDYHAGRGDVVYSHCPLDYQRSAVKWLCDNAITPPTWMFPSSVMMRIGNDNGDALMGGMETMAINALMSNSRWSRMLQNQSLNGQNAYTVDAMLGDLRAFVFRELATGAPIGLSRRTAQREFVRALSTKLASSSENRIHAMAELKTDLKAINGAIGRTSDSLTVAHLEELKKQVEFALANPDKMGGGATTQAFPFLVPQQSWCGYGTPVDYREWFE